MLAYHYKCHHIEQKDKKALEIKAFFTGKHKPSDCNESFLLYSSLILSQKSDFQVVRLHLLYSEKCYCFLQNSFHVSFEVVFMNVYRLSGSFCENLFMIL